MRSVLIAAFVVAANAGAAEPMHYVELVNTARTSLASFEVGAADSGVYRAIPIGAVPLQGGGESTTLAIGGEGCLRDFRLRFADGRQLVQRGFDICKLRSYHTGRYLGRGEAPERALVER